MEDLEFKTCPYCGEKILAIAKKCKHCGEWLTDNIAETQYRRKMKQIMLLSMVMMRTLQLPLLLVFIGMVCIWVKSGDMVYLK